MSNPMVGKLIGKELTLNRFFIGGATLAGLVSLAISVLGKVAFAVGGIMFLTALVAYAVTLPMFSIAGERKEKTRLFVLSLPVSRGEYIRAKVAGVALSFLGPWALLLVVALTLILATPIPDGMVVYTMLTVMFALTDFCVIVCAAMLVTSEAGQAIVIIFMNMSVTFFIVGISALTRVGPDSIIDAINWSTPALTILGAEIAVVVAVFGVLFFVTGREPEVV
jgi:ABC-2 type transport system permease protein